MNYLENVNEINENLVCEKLISHKINRFVLSHLLTREIVTEILRFFHRYVDVTDLYEIPLTFLPKDMNERVHELISGCEGIDPETKNDIINEVRV